LAIRTSTKKDNYRLTKEILLTAVSLLIKVGIEFDAWKFEYPGVPAHDDTAIGFSKQSAMASVEQRLAAKTTLKFGAWL
jgi:hypothetical protein